MTMTLSHFRAINICSQRAGLDGTSLGAKTHGATEVGRGVSLLNGAVAVQPFVNQRDDRLRCAERRIDTEPDADRQVRQNKSAVSPGLDTSNRTRGGLRRFDFRTRNGSTAAVTNRTADLASCLSPCSGRKNNGC